MIAHPSRPRRLRASVASGDGALIRYHVAQHAQPLHFNFADIAMPHPQRRLASGTDPGRRAGDDDIAGLEAEGLAQHRDQRGNVEDKVVRRGALHRLAIQPRLQSQAATARRQLVGGDEPRSKCTGRVEILAHRPLGLLNW